MSFRQHFMTKVAVIVDCFQVFCRKPNNHMAKADTFSSYKHHNVVKFVIGVTPQDVISYVSKAWGDRTPGIHFTGNCGIMRYLSPGNVILADMGFDIRDSAVILADMGFDIRDSATLFGATVTGLLRKHYDFATHPARQ